MGGEACIRGQRITVGMVLNQLAAGQTADDILADFPPRWVDSFRSAGMGAHHWSTIGPSNAPDRILFEYAGQQDFVILTHDLDFGAILASGGGATPSVVQLRGPDLRPEQASCLYWRPCVKQAPNWEPAPWSRDARRTRIRILPLNRAGF